MRVPKARYSVSAQLSALPAPALAALPVGEALVQALAARDSARSVRPMGLPKAVDSLSARPVPVSEPAVPAVMVAQSGWVPAPPPSHWVTRRAQAKVSPRPSAVA